MPREPGAAKASAKWLYEHVGVGGVFTKAQLREAVPGREQVDRRARDLRPVGWVIDTYREDESLSPEELRLVTVGDHCWEPGYKWPAKSSVSGKVRREVYDRDHNCCVVCGMAAGEYYPDDPARRVRLTLGHLVPKGRRGTNEARNLRTECQRCNEGAGKYTPPPVDLELLKATIGAMKRSERAKLHEWIKSGTRAPSETDLLWLRFRQLPAEQRDEIAALVESLPHG